jgi:hypothetical protein
MGINLDTQATRSTLMSVDSTLSEAITASQTYIPIASTTNFSTSVVAEIETTNEVVSFTDISANILTYSQDFDNGDWTKNATTITTDSTTAPDGTTTADKMISTSTSGGFVEESPTVTVGQPYTFSIFAKAGDTNWIRIANQSSGTSGGWFNLTDGTLGTENGAGNVSSITSEENLYLLYQDHKPFFTEIVLPMGVLLLLVVINLFTYGVLRLKKQVALQLIYLQHQLL